MARKTSSNRRKGTTAEPTIRVSTSDKSDVVCTKSASASKMSICIHMVKNYNFNKPKPKEIRDASTIAGDEVKTKESKEEVLIGLLLEMQKTSQDAKQFVDRHHDRISLVLTTIISTIIHCYIISYFSGNS